MTSNFDKGMATIMEVQSFYNINRLTGIHHLREERARKGGGRLEVKKGKRERIWKQWSHKEGQLVYKV